MNSAEKQLTLTSPEPSVFTELLPKLSLNKLILSDCNLAKDFIPFMQGLSAQTQLREIYLTNCNVTQQQSALLLKQLSALEYLKTLSITKGCINFS